MGLFLKKVTVEQIHAEFDSAQDKILDQVNIMVKDSTNVLENKKLQLDRVIEEKKNFKNSPANRKAEKLKSLGFNNSELVREIEALEKQRREVEDELLRIRQKITITEKTANDINQLKNKYPLDKFITIEELERICNKYNLIHAPVGHYIKDVPEKNIEDMVNRKPLDYMDKAKNRKIFKYDGEFFSNATKKQIKELKKGVDITDLKIRSGAVFSLDNNDYTKAIYGESGRSICRWDNIYGGLIEVNRQGLFIAAPKSHFNLEGLDKKSKFGFYLTKVEVTDPVVFEYCRDGLVRIITKWGTEDDQSYLDPALVNEKLN